MIRKYRANLLLFTAALVLGSQPAAGQTSDPAAVTEITVVAPRTVTNRFKPSVPSEVAGATISLRLIVLYPDLDLASPTGSARLMTRINSAARDACKYLDRLYPLDPDKECIDRAVASAAPLAEAAIAAARKQGAP